MLLGCAYKACCVQRSRVPSVCAQAVSHSHDADFISLRPSTRLGTRFPNIFPHGRQLCFNEHAQKEGLGKGEFFGLSLSGGIKSGYLNTWNTDVRSGRKCSLSKNAAKSPCPASKEEPMWMAKRRAGDPRLTALMAYRSQSGSHCLYVEASHFLWFGSSLRSTVTTD